MTIGQAAQEQVPTLEAVAAAADRLKAEGFFEHCPPRGEAIVAYVARAAGDEAADTAQHLSTCMLCAAAADALARAVRSTSPASSAPTRSRTPKSSGGRRPRGGEPRALKRAAAPIAALRQWTDERASARTAARGSARATTRRSSRARSRTRAVARRPKRGPSPRKLARSIGLTFAGLLVVVLLATALAGGKAPQRLRTDHGLASAVAIPSRLGEALQARALERAAAHERAVQERELATARRKRAAAIKAHERAARKAAARRHAVKARHSRPGPAPASAAPASPAPPVANPAPAPAPRPAPEPSHPSNPSPGDEFGP